jgi:hypothetical protein
MKDGYTNDIERMLSVMTLVPPYGWGILLREVEKRIGTDALQRIIENVYLETERRKIDDLKRALAVIKQEERKTPRRDKCTEIHQ